MKKRITPQRLKKARPFLSKIWIILRWVLLIILLFILLGSLNVFFEAFGWLIGSGDHTQKVGPNETYIPGKTLWDWLDLLIVPVALALGALWVNRNRQKNERRRAEQEKETEREIASGRNQEAALQAYLDRMTELLLKENLRDSQPEDEVRTVARIRTLTILRGLEKERKEAVIWFLIESGLVVSERKDDNTKPVISLFKAELSGINLAGADLRGADLRNVNLSGSTLTASKLNGADLHDAKLVGVKLMATDLSGAKLIRTDLRKADLTGATVTECELHQTPLLQEAIMPNGEFYDPNKFSEQVLTQ
jgi:uncharacterized protein YjbI with pentapeptide repeats